ncbi:MAG: hypothetical protein ABIA37_01955 [Candidatus Woesearchaeota archaeon]
MRDNPNKSDLDRLIKTYLDDDPKELILETIIDEDRDAPLIVNRPVRSEVQEINYHIGLFGMNSAAEELFRYLNTNLKSADFTNRGVIFSTKYLVQLFGGKEDRDLGIISARLSLFKPNYLIAIISGIDNLHQNGYMGLVQLTYALTHELGKGNLGAFQKQQPYALAFVIDQKIPSLIFRAYQNHCNERDILPARKQFGLEQQQELINDINLTVKNYFGR